MEFIGHFRRLTPVQRNTFIACFLGWSLDAFDFFILTFCLSAIATEFQTKVSVVLEAVFLTLVFRPVGAFLFGLAADRVGRRTTLMVDIIAYAVFELSSAWDAVRTGPPPVRKEMRPPAETPGSRRLLPGRRRLSSEIPSRSR